MPVTCEAAEYDQLAHELKDVKSEEQFLSDYPELYSANGLRQMRRARLVRYVVGPRGEISYPISECIRLVRQRVMGGA